MKMKHRKKILIGIAVLAAVIATWFIIPPVGRLSPEAISSLRASTIASVLRYRGDGKSFKSAMGPTTNFPFNVCFLGVTPPESDILHTNPSDPPSELLSQLPKLPVPVLPASQMSNKSLVPQYVDSPWSKYTDAQGKRGVLLMTGKCRRIRQNIVVVQGALLWGDLAAIGFDIYHIRTPFGWIAILRKQTWVS